MKIEKRHFIIVSLVGLVVFLLLINLASQENNNGYSFFNDVFSILGMSDGNTMGIFTLAMVILGVSIIITYLILDKRKARWDLKKIGIYLGVIAGLLFIFITLFPLDSQGDMHLIIVSMIYLCLIFSSIILARVYYPKPISYPFVILAVGVTLYLMTNVFAFTLGNSFLQAISQKGLFYLIILVVFSIITLIVWKNYRRERYWFMMILFLVFLFIILLLVVPIQEELILIYRGMR